MINKKLWNIEMRKVLLQMRRVPPMPRWRSNETLQRTKKKSGA